MQTTLEDEFVCISALQGALVTKLATDNANLPAQLFTLHKMIRIGGV